MATEAPTIDAPTISLTAPDPVRPIAIDKAAGLVPLKTEQATELEKRVDGFVEDLVAQDAYSPEFGKLHNEAKAELDAKKRHDMYVKMQDLMEESGSYVFLTHGVTGLVYRNSVVAATMPHGAPIFHKFAVA